MTTRFERSSVALLGAAVLTAFAISCASQTAGPAPTARAATPSAPAGPTPTPRPAHPASQVPDQPYVGTPRPDERPYLEILRLKEGGESNEALLEKVRQGRVVYSMSTFDIQKLRAAGVSEEVIAAMLASGREVRTPTPRGS